MIFVPDHFYTSKNGTSVIPRPRPDLLSGCQSYSLPLYSFAAVGWVIKDRFIFSWLSRVLLSRLLRWKNILLPITDIRLSKKIHLNKNFRPTLKFYVLISHLISFHSHVNKTNIFTLFFSTSKGRSLDSWTFYIFTCRFRHFEEWTHVIKEERRAEGDVYGIQE